MPDALRGSQTGGVCGWAGGRRRGTYYDPCAVRTEAPSERTDNSGEGVGRLPRRLDDEHGDDGLQELVVYSL